MARYQHRRKTAAAAVPVAGDFLDGEIIFNVADGKLYFKNSGGTVIRAITTLDVSAAAMTVLDDASVSAMLTTLGGQPVNTFRQGITDRGSVALYARDSVNLVNGSNLDTVLTPGLYSSYAPVNGPAMLGTGWFYLDVMRHQTDGSYLAQTIYGGLDSADTTQHRIWHRRRVATAWSAWQELAPADNPHAYWGTGGTPTAVDRNRLILIDNASPQTFTIPPNSTTAFPIGTKMQVCQWGAGQVTIAPGSGVTIPSTGGALKTARQYSVAGLQKVDTNNWLAFGDLTT